jgi:hypothetical protein
MLFRDARHFTLVLLISALFWYLASWLWTTFREDLRDPTPLRLGDYLAPVLLLVLAGGLFYFSVVHFPF